MNDEGALHRRPRPQLSRRSEVTTGAGRVAPRFILEIPLECRGQAYLVAESFEDELRLRRWLRHALCRRQCLSAALTDLLDELDGRDELEAA